MSTHIEIMKIPKGFEHPKTNIQEILMTLIIKGSVSTFDYSYLSGYRTRISELINKYGLKLERTTASRFNKFSNKYSYAIYSLPKFDTGHYDKRQVKKLYKKLTVGTDG